LTEVCLHRIEKFSHFFQTGTKRINAIYGGAGSGKSYSTAQEIILKFLTEEDIRILVVRKTLPSLRITAYLLIKDLLSELQVPFQLNKTEMLISLGRNQILFKSLDDPEKIKSYEANYVWIEEATDITKEDLMQLNLRLRRPNKNGQNKIYLTFNPIDAYHHLITDIVQGNREDVAIHHSTYKDNLKHLSPEYVKELESLIEQDENYYRIYALGEPGILKNTIYSNYEIYTGDWPKDREVFYGLDFGFNNATALLKVNLYDNQPFLEEKIYQSGLTNSDLIGKLNYLEIPKTAPIYADAAEPQRISEIRRAGYNIFPANKSVPDGIDQVKRFRLKIHPESVNLIKEIRAYKYREDKDGRVLDEPVKFNDHAMDTLRYAVHTHIERNRGIGIRISGKTRTW
jgi:phage terminase large subunit